jgi:transcriptional regulator with XRE-family HTH domain
MGEAKERPIVSQIPDTPHERLAHERKRLNLSQDETAKALGMAVTGYRKYETGERRLHQDRNEALSKLGFDILFIVTGARDTGSNESRQFAGDSTGLSLRDYWILQGKLEQSTKMYSQLLELLENLLADVAKSLREIKKTE